MNGLSDNYSLYLGNQACRHVKRSIFSLDKLQLIGKLWLVLKDNSYQINDPTEVGIFVLVFQKVVLCFENLFDF